MAQDMKRFRFSVPEDDAVCIEWLAAQHNTSMSLRELIKQAVEDRGMKDMFSTQSGEIIQKPRRGRPPKIVYDETIVEDVQPVQSIEEPVVPRVVEIVPEVVAPVEELISISQPVVSTPVAPAAAPVVEVKPIATSSDAQAEMLKKMQGLM